MAICGYEWPSFLNGGILSANSRSPLIFFLNCSAQPFVEPELSFEHHSVARQAFHPEIQPREPPQLPLLVTFAVSLEFLLSITRRKVDEEQLRKVCAAIDDGMLVGKAAEVFGVGRTSIEDRRRGLAAMNPKVDTETILSNEEEDSLEDILLFAARNFLAVHRVHLKDGVRRLCNDGRRIPWDPEKRVRGKIGLRASFVGTHGWRSARPASTRQIGSPKTRSLAWCSTTPQGTKTTKAFAESGQKVVGAMRSNSRENTTVVATISVDGHTWAPTIIFKGQRLQADWFVERNGPEGARYTCTDSSFMQGDVFIAYLKDFHKQLGDRGLLDGKPHILLLDGHASHVSVQVFRLAMNLRIILFQLPSHTSHITQPLNVVAFGRFKKSVTRVLASFYHNSGGLLPLKRDMPSVIADASKKKERRDERPPLQDVPIAALNEQLEKDIGERALRVSEGARAHRHGDPSRHGVSRWPLDSKEAPRTT
ncbi:unnamed protein product [Ectocarpus sp. CCAP 1310/34]|nr:unnamed protein product [Ectocarpus sp. CCAP 1310/34]